MSQDPEGGQLTATYPVVAAVGNARQFSTAKQFASWLGLTPNGTSQRRETATGRDQQTWELDISDTCWFTAHAHSRLGQPKRRG